MKIGVVSFPIAIVFTGVRTEDLHVDLSAIGLKIAAHSKFFWILTDEEIGGVELCT